MLNLITSSILSSSANLFFLIAPHFLHLKTITYPFLGLNSSPTGSKIPWQLSALSPGLMSKCFECKQYGQWFLQVYPNLGTFLPQFSHINSSSILVNLLFLTSTSPSFYPLKSPPPRNSFNKELDGTKSLEIGLK